MDMQDETKGLNDEFLGQKIGEGLDPTRERMLLTSSLQSAWHGHLAPCCISCDIPAGMETLSLVLQELWCSPPSMSFVRSFIPSAPALSGAPGGHQRLQRAFHSPLWALAILVPCQGGRQGAGGWVPSVFGRTGYSSGGCHAESCSPASLLV